jgi:hypothetical protein
MSKKDTTKYVEVQLKELNKLNMDNDVEIIDNVDYHSVTKKPISTGKKENVALNFIKKILHKLLIDSCFPVKNKLSNKIILFFLLSILGWLFVFLITGPSALPGGLYFSLIVLIVCAHSFGYVIELIKMPPLLGMLIAGIFFKNVPVLSIVGKSVDSYTSSILRY